MAEFAKYAFNKSMQQHMRWWHIDGLAKYQYPVEYLAALMTSVSGKHKQSCGLYPVLQEKRY